jgi:HEAT repeat protein
MAPHVPRQARRASEGTRPNPSPPAPLPEAERGEQDARRASEEKHRPSLARRACGVLLVLLLATGCSSRPPYQGRSVAELERMLGDPDAKVQTQGAYGLGLLGEKAVQAVPALAKALKAKDVLVRQQAAGALGQVGPGAAEAVPALIEALADPEWTVRRQAAVTLGRIGLPARPAAEAALERCTRDAHNLVRKAAQEALAKVRG